MTIDEKVDKTFSELGVNDSAGVEGHYEDLRRTMEAERSALVSSPPAADIDRQMRAKDLRDRWLARHGGILARVDEHWLKAAPKDLKPVAGRCFNSLRHLREQFEVEKILGSMSVSVSAIRHYEEIARQDLTLPGYRRPLGSIHPVTRVLREIEEIFLNLGFSIESGPEVESVYYNFEALNIPENHPARDMWDTIYVDSETVLRTHTSPVQIRAMKKRGAPLYIICPGKCYRHDNPDSSHATMFHQVEGMAVDTDITFADLKGTLDFFAKKFFGENIRTNFFPSFFPFTEPSGDLAISCAICDGRGCRVCKESGWLEVMGCGVVHPEVLRYGGIDPSKFTGWAFGLGVERFAMMKYGINDIQLFTQSDLRFLEQF